MQKSRGTSKYESGGIGVEMQEQGVAGGTQSPPTQGNPTIGLRTRLASRVERLDNPFIVLPGDMIDAGLIRASIATIKPASDIRFGWRRPSDGTDIEDDARLVILTADEAPHRLLYSDTFGNRFDRRSLVAESLNKCGRRLFSVDRNEMVVDHQLNILELILEDSFANIILL